MTQSPTNSSPHLLVKTNSEMRFDSAIDKAGWLFFAFLDGTVELDYHDYIVQRHLKPMRQSLVSFFLPFYNALIGKCRA